MDIKEIDNIISQITKKYLEYQIINKPIIEKAVIFFNQYYNLIEHQFTKEDADKLANNDFSLKLDYFHWTAITPKTDEEIRQFYRNAPFNFFRNLYKNMDIMHYEIMLKENILSNLKENKQQTILDYGGGSGYLAILLYKIGYKVSFAEINKISIEWMKYITKELGMDIEIIDLWEKEIEDTYDAIILKDVLEHLSKPKDTLDKLRNKAKNLIIIPDKMEKKEDYLPMHFPYSFNND